MLILYFSKNVWNCWSSEVEEWAKQHSCVACHTFTLPDCPMKAKNSILKHVPLWWIQIVVYSQEVQNGRLFRLLAKLGTINERPEWVAPVCEDWPVCDLCICYHSVTVCLSVCVCVCVCVCQVSEGPDVVRDGRPLPVEAFPGSPVSPGDRSWDALDRPQPHCLLPQQSQSTFFFFPPFIYLFDEHTEIWVVFCNEVKHAKWHIFSEHLFMLRFHWLKKHACICQLIAEEGE